MQLATMRSRHLSALLLLLVLLAVVWPFWSAHAELVTGIVSSADGPIAGARVRWQALPASVVTDLHGRFVLPQAANRRRVTAWKQGFFIAGADARATPVELKLHSLPSVDNADYEWVEPGPKPAGKMNCVNCHADIYREWERSGHARSATGKFFLDLYAGTDWHGNEHKGWSLLDQYPDGSGVCASCHAPTASGAGLFDLRDVKVVAARGVHCDLCHKVADVDNERIGITHGRDGLKLLRPEKGQLFFGPLDDVDRGEDAFAPVYRESRYCASCHEGVVFGVHVYSTYSEWQASPAARAGVQCQGCHMKPTGTMTNVAPGHGGVERDPATLASHDFPGGNLAMLRRSLTLAARLDGPTVDVSVRADHVGHRVPTGFIDRHLILVVEGRDPEGRIVELSSGPKLPAAVGAKLTGKPGKLYAKLLHAEGGQPLPFWQGDKGKLVDTRLHPERDDRSRFAFGQNVAEVRIKLLYRRFWEAVRVSKGWPTADVVILERRLKS